MATKGKLKEVINKSRGRIAAGVLAGSLLFGGLVNTTIQKKQNDDLRKEVANAQVINNEKEQEIEALKREIAATRELLAGSTKKLDKIEDLVDKLNNDSISASEFAMGVEALKEALGKETDAVVENAIAELEKGQYSKDAAMKVLNLLAESAQYGVITNYSKAFMSVERIEEHYRDQFAKGNENDDLKNKIHEVQYAILDLAVYNGFEKNQRKTGYSQLQVASLKDARVTSIITNAEGNWVQRDWQDGENIRLGTYDGQELWTFNKVMVRVPEVKQEFATALHLELSKNINLLSILSMLGDGNYTFTDFTYDAKAGYKVYYKLGTGENQKDLVSTIQFAKDGSIEFMEYAEVINGHKTITGEARAKSITKEEYAKKFKEAFDEIQKNKDNQVVNE